MRYSRHNINESEIIEYFKVMSSFDFLNFKKRDISCHSTQERERERDREIENTYENIKRVRERTHTKPISREREITHTQREE